MVGEGGFDFWERVTVMHALMEIRGVAGIVKEWLCNAVCSQWMGSDINNSLEWMFGR